MAGLLAGAVLNGLIRWLPLRLQQDWQREARHALGLEEDTSPPLRFSLATGNPKSMQTLLVYAASVLSALAVVSHFGFSFSTALLLVFTWALLALTAIDLNTRLLPDSITLPLLWLGLLANTRELLVPLADAVFGAALGYLLLWSVYWLFKLLTGKEGMGRGDFKLLAALGAWLGWQMLPLILILASVAGVVSGIIGILFLGRDRRFHIAFGPYLAVAGWIALLWGTMLMSVYMRIQ